MASPVTTTLHLVRHAETASNAEGRTQGQRDEPLTERGRAQASALARMLQDANAVAVYSSDSLRALHTAEAIAGTLGLGVTADPRLREMHQGILDGLTAAELRAGHADFLERWRADDPTDLRMPEGETLGEVRARMVQAVQAIAEAHAGTAVVVVSHNLALKALLCHALGLPLAAHRRMRVDVASITEVEVRQGAPWTVNRLNEQCHLAE
jgi:probable phosphoglycerate mutase